VLTSFFPTAPFSRFPAWVNHADFFNAPKPLEASYRLPDNSMARTLFSSQVSERWAARGSAAAGAVRC